MKVRVSSEIIVGVQVTQKQVCPAGTAYWQVDYMVGGVCIHSATTGAIWGNPDIVAMLDREYEIREEHYQDIPNPDPKPENEDESQKMGWNTIGSGTIGGRPAWWQNKMISHRQAIIDKYNQLVIE